jgi:hypothetical protein
VVGGSTFERNLSNPSEASASGFPENRYEALEESRRFLGLTESDFRSLLKVLCRTEFGILDFSFGKVAFALSASGVEGVCLNVGLEEGPIEKSTMYKFKLSEHGLTRKQSGLDDFGGE